MQCTWSESALWTLACVVLTACGPSSTEEPTGGSASDTERGAAVAAARGEAPTRAVLPGLFTIMAGLERDMAGLDRGLWREDFDTIAARARAIAEHPTVPADEAQTIAGVLGPDMADFKRMDTDVHDLAVRIRELAAAGDLEGILTATADLDRGCVRCHTRFRSRLREGVR